MTLQFVSRRFLNLSRDNNLWRTLCFEHSAAERRRRRLEPSSSDVDPRLAELIRAANEVANAFPVDVHDPSAPSAEAAVQKKVAKRKAALLANWDPTYPGEKVDFYQEFIQRHAPHSISWFQHSRHGHRDDHLHHEATGAGVLYGAEGLAEKLVAPLEDGSICIWDAAASDRQGRIVARTPMGLLPNKGVDLDNDTRLAQSRAAMTETGAVECVSIDSALQKAFFSVQNTLNEVDLRTLQVVSRTPYPFPITALSEAHHPTPLTVGTNWTVHLHDTRSPPPLPTPSRCELIAGPSSFSRLQTGDFGSHVSLAQPGALSILHLPPTRAWDANGDIWVAGRFTSILNFDRRFFPRLRGTLHSGARLSCLSALPYPFLPPDLRPSTRAAIKPAPGITLVAAGEYKGKGSLELYASSPDPTRSVNTSDVRSTRNPLASYLNRQTASASKLLAVAPHGTRIAYADGDGNVRWVERDGRAGVRGVNINAAEGERAASSSSWSAAEAPPPPEDIVQKIMPTANPSLHARTTRPAPLGRDNLFVWTGGGRLGQIGFEGEAWSEDVFYDAAEQVDSAEGLLREREREVVSAMRRALEGHAREVRWLGGYGLS